MQLLHVTHCPVQFRTEYSLHIFGHQILKPRLVEDRDNLLLHQAVPEADGRCLRLRLVFLLYRHDLFCYNC